MVEVVAEPQLPSWHSVTALLLLVSVTVFENDPPIWLPLESRTSKPEIGVELNDEPAVPLGSVPITNEAGGVPFGATVGCAVGLGDTNGVGVAVALDVAVGRIVGEVDGDAIGLDDEVPVAIGVGVEPGEAVEPLPPLGIGVGPLDAVDVG